MFLPLSLLSLAACIQGSAMRASPRAAGQNVPSGQDVTAFIAQLRQSISLDAQNPPWTEYQATSNDFTFCSEWRCDEFHQWNRTALNSINSVDIHYMSHYNNEILNQHASERIVETYSSTSVSVSPNPGWLIKATFDSGTKKAQVAYSPYTVPGKVVSSSSPDAPDTMVCPAGYGCYIKTLTFYFIVQGVCRIEPHLKCLGTYKVCDWSFQPCQFFQFFYNDYCTRAPDTVPCTIQVPLNDPQGRPVTMKLGAMNKLSDGYE
ncbi:hypothetical protein UVI_02058400 [Ustilaginoidea virens]|uniref:Uncharacterized protein n=1 Tax=Ustilaginoidea virens TaxID=1159556 RepID=A0A1B5L2K1_USTVR|nr:hypothetical protein UVI_02058400 [Ustilaginoidea virens]